MTGKQGRDLLTRGKLVELYETQKLSIKKIARMLHLSARLVTEKFDEYGLRVRGRVEFKGPHPNSKGVKKAELEYLYLIERLSTVEVGAKLKVAQSTVSRLLKRFDIPTRSVGQATLLGWERKGYVPQYQERVKSIEGYWMVRVPGHHRSDHQGYVKEHMVIWERHHGVQLAADSVVHHIDGDVTRNRVENLRMFSNSEHSRFHAFARCRAGTGRKACPKDMLAVFLVAWDKRIAGKSATPSATLQMELF